MYKILFIYFILCLYPVKLFAQTGYSMQDVKFQSQGVALAGSMFLPEHITAAVVIVHGSDPVKREVEFAKRLAQDGIAVLTYDKRGVGESGGTYVGPSVGTNNIDSSNLHVLAHDASEAVNTFMGFLKDDKLPMGLVGFSQAGWIIPIAANLNPKVQFMLLYSGPTITTLEQLRFQFYTNGNEDFWDKHTEKEAREHVQNDPDRYSFLPTDPKILLSELSLPGLWIFGEKDIQIPVKMCMEQINSLKAKGKPYDYVLFPHLGHATTGDDEAFQISVQWIKQKALVLQRVKE